MADHVYLHLSALPALSCNQNSIITQAAEIAHLKAGEHFNVVKLSHGIDDLSLLDYPTFFEDPFPILARSWRVSVTRKSVVFRSYTESRNPPILHRKELLLPPDNPQISEFTQLTESAESLGLFDEPNKIGFREHWYRLIGERGYELVGSEFVPLANVAASGSEASVYTTDFIQRHLTALSRYNFSAPVQALSRHGLIEPRITFFDYGCGRGDDVRGLTANGIDATGWDPHFAPHAEKRVADIVNIGFVINVIEDINERVEALQGAYAHTRRVLAVAAMLSSQTMPEGRQFRDGYMTSRNTFQKYFTQAQLRDFVEHTLEDVAIAVSPGVFFVFRDKDVEQQFLARRYGRRASTILSRGWSRERPVREKAPQVNQETRLFNDHQPLFERLWIDLLKLGRTPDREEIDNLAELESAVGSVNKALRIVQSRFEMHELNLARTSRTADLLVMLAMQQFEKRKPYSRLEPGLRRDIRAFFGDYTSARDLAKQILFKVGDIEAIDRACREASVNGLGWREESQSLQFHISLLERLPTELRIYVNCSTVLCGDISTFDLVKIHIRSGKVTLMKFEDFEGSPLPRLTQRVKLSLRDQDMDVFNYDAEHPPTLLYRKSRYINEEYPKYADQVAFEEALERLEIIDFSGYGPTETQFHHSLARARWEVQDFSLIRSRRIPELGEPCGAYFTYRQFIECGETQTRSKIANLPKDPDTYTALFDLATNILDPLIEYFGMVQLTYGFSSAELSRKITKRIAPELDQHACHEKKRTGEPFCGRPGAAVDFLVKHENMRDVASWIVATLPFDRLYFYGENLPVHVSFGPQQKRDAFEMVETAKGKLTPRPFRPTTQDPVASA